MGELRSITAQISFRLWCELINVSCCRHTTVIGVESGEGDPSRDDQVDEEVKLLALRILEL